VNILVVYHLDAYPVRSTILDSLYSFRHYSGHSTYYVNLALRRPPRSLSQFRPDLIIFHTVLLSDRTLRDHFDALVAKVACLKDHPAVKVVLPQDEYINTDELCAFINEMGVTHVFSCAPPQDWPIIYADVDPSLGVRYHRVLTGYLSDHILRRIEARAARHTHRDIDIGYRAWCPWPSLGRHGQLKGLIGEVFARRAPLAGLRVDISTDPRDTILGDQWYDFLLRCKYTIGVEGGASLLDRDGSLAAHTGAYLTEHPDASFEEVEAACFPGLDGSIDYFAVSPRHLECCATKTCQVLVEGEFNGVLEPGVHYIPLKRDLSNVDDVIATVVDDSCRETMVERAHADVVSSGRWTYAGFVAHVVETAMAGTASSARSSLRQRWTVLRGRACDEAGWARRAAKYSSRRAAVRALGEERVLSTMRRVRSVMRMDPK
jgi:hypothetical protein